MGRSVQTSQRGFHSSGAAPSSEVTRILSAIEQGDPHASDLGATLNNMALVDLDQQQFDKASARLTKKLAKLPEAERATLKQLWTEVDQLLTKAAGGK